MRMQIGIVQSSQAREFLGATMMKNILKKAVVVTCLLGSVAASAAVPSPYAGSSFSDTVNFSVSSLSSVTIDYSWNDMVLNKSSGSFHREIDASSISWTLNGVSQPLWNVADAAGVLSGGGTQSLGNLVAGNYTLKLDGIWNGVTLSGGGNAGLTAVGGRVDLLENTLSKTVIAAVPEPESYAMLLAGLGLMGTIARRRRQN